MHLIKRIREKVKKIKVGVAQISCSKRCNRKQQGKPNSRKCGKTQRYCNMCKMILRYHPKGKTIALKIDF